MNDRIGDLIIRIKNAGAVKHKTVEVEYTKLNEAICATLKSSGFISDFKVKGKKVSAKTIEITLAYTGSKPKVTEAVRISKLSKRVYIGSDEIKTVKRGHGVLVMSTPKGILTGDQAKKEKVGGEMLFKLS